MIRDLDYTTLFLRDNKSIPPKEFDDFLRIDVEEYNKSRDFKTTMGIVYSDLNNGYTLHFNGHKYQYNTLVTSKSARDILDFYMDIDEDFNLYDILDKFSENTIKEIISLIPKIKKENNEYSFFIRKD